MLTEIYIEALLIDEGLADQVWDRGEIDDSMAAWGWWAIAASSTYAPLYYYRTWRHLRSPADT